jgi:hypothetical protein
VIVVLCARDAISAFIKSGCSYLPHIFRTAAALSALDLFFSLGGGRFIA